MEDFADVVRRYMDERGTSVRATARAAGYSDHTLLSKALNGHKSATPHLARRLDEALNANGEIIAAAERAHAVDEAAVLPLRELADHAAELGAWAETGAAGPGTIAALDEEIRRVTSAYGASPAGPLILRASDVCRRTFGFLRQHQRLRHAHDLYVIAARCCAFLAVALGDLGRQAEAGAYARTALTLAEESAEPGAVALALSALSKVAFWDGHRQQSASLAARGHATARKGDPLRVLLACQHADASPVPLARDMLAAAAVAREETSGDGMTGTGLFDCGGVRLAGYVATLGLREGSLAAVLGAVAVAEAAIKCGEQVPYGSLAQVRLCAALALLAAGDADQAAGQLAPVLGLSPEMRLATFTGRLSQCAALASAAPYKGSVTARKIAEDVAGYLGGESVAMPHPLAVGPRECSVNSVSYHWWWRPGWHAGRRFYTIHATFADAPEVQALAAKARNRLAKVPGLDLIPDQWLHLTMQGIGFTDEVDDADLSAIITEAGKRLAAVSPVTVAIGPPMLAGEGVACWASPPRALDPIRDAVRAGIASTWGPARVPEAEEWAAHVSVAYASADGPGEPIEAALGGLVDVAESTVQAVDLIRLSRDRHMYEWETVERLRLGAAG